jgi:hypothetical protein
MNMQTLAYFLAIVLFISSCRTSPNSDKRYDDLNGRVYKLHLVPYANTKYSYAITNESRMEMEVDSKTIENDSKADVKPLTPASFKPESKWRMGVNTGGFSTPMRV